MSEPKGDREPSSDLMPSFRAFALFLVVHDTILYLVIQTRSFGIGQYDFHIGINALEIFSTTRDRSTGP